MRTIAQNLKSYSGRIENDGSVTVIPYNDARSWFAIQDLSDLTQTDTRIWIGPLPPPADKALWLKMPDGQLVFERGIAGPIYLAETGSKAVALGILSSEGDGTTYTQQLSLLALFENITTDAGIVITDDSGDPITTGY